MTSTRRCERKDNDSALSARKSPWLDLRSRDYDVFVCADAVGARGSMDHDLALDRMRQEGVIVTSVESVLFGLCGRCDVPRFKKMLEVIKSAPPADD